MAYLTDLAEVLRAAGLKVVEIPGWKTRGRPGSFAPRGVLCHHTGGAGDGLAYARWMALEGRSDLSAPLAQLGLDRKGTFYVLAAGRANHAGRCKPIAGLSAYPGRSYGDGNAQLLGIEAMNTGSEGWTPAQYSAYVRGCAALNARYGWPVSRTLGHKETSLSGKPDPGGIEMNRMRRDVAASSPSPTTSLEDDMPTPADLWRADIIPSPDKEASNPTWQPDSYLRETFRLLRSTRTEVIRNRASIEALSAAVTALSTSQGADPDAIAALVDKAVRDRLASLEVDVVVSDAAPSA